MKKLRLRGNGIYPDRKQVTELGFELSVSTPSQSLRTQPTCVCVYTYACMQIFVCVYVEYC